MEIAKGLIETLKRISTLLNEAGISHCLIGGLAVSILAKPRATEDIDLLVLIAEKGKKVVEDIFKNNFDLIQNQGVTVFEKARIWRIVVKDQYSSENGIVVIDMILADEKVYQEALADTLRIEIEGATIPIVRPEHLIKIKSISNRPVDLLDIEAIKESMSV